VNNTVINPTTYGIFAYNDGASFNSYSTVANNTVNGPSGGTGILDMTNMPASIDFWVRFRTYPEATNKEGMAYVMDAGAEEERNRISF
jgi:hypothetical protein